MDFLNLERMKISEVKITDIIQDDKNLNKGTADGKAMITKSLQRFGAGRSILLDKNNRIIAGNKTHENAEEIGMEDVIVVESDGSKLVAVKRTDIDLDSKEGREMALADNATVKVDLSWDDDAMREVSETWGIDTEEWGISNDDDDILSDGYSQKIGQVIYEPKQTNHKIRDLYYDDSLRFNEVIDKIQNEELRAMLKLRAAWFVDFDFSKIADYYAYQATEDEQRAFEALGLVLLDLDGLIENGYSDIIKDFENERNH